jgi:hypothetical protein
MFLFHHVESFQPIYKALMSKRGADWITQEVQAIVLKVLRRHLESQPPPGDLPFEVLVQYRASALMGLIRWWLDNDMPYSAGQMQRWFHELSVLPLSF